LDASIIGSLLATLGRKQDEREVMMSLWEKHDCEGKIRQVLSEVQCHDPDHHFGTPFLTAYQLAIEFATRFPAVFEQLGYPVGGKGTGEHYSLTLYLANQLSRNIREGTISDIEGSFLSDNHLSGISFHYGDKRIDSSLARSGYDLSIFRLR
jgi:hypothetical protein